MGASNTENLKQIFPEKELHGISPNFHIHLTLNDYIISQIGMPNLIHEIIWTDFGNI